MSPNDKRLIPVFVPALSALLLNAEDKKGQPLTYDEVIALRDTGACIMMGADDVSKLEERRGYRDIDPETCWYDWQQLRRELGRKPDIDPGPKFYQTDSEDADYQEAIRQARETLDRFRNMLFEDGSPRPEAMVKTLITQGDNRAFMWLSNTRKTDTGFLAQFFEVPASISEHRVGDELEIPAESVLDWMVLDRGVLHGGFSLRYQRSKLPEHERKSYDAYIGVTEYA